MSDILFVVPVMEPVFHQEIGGTLLLATILKNHGIDADVFRFYDADMTKGFQSYIKESVKGILSHNPRIVSFYCRCDAFLTDIKIAQELKRQRPDVYVVFGGPQADASSGDIMRELPWVDYCCCGEGENTVCLFFSGLLSGGDVTGIDGLCYRNEAGEVVCNPRPDLIKNLDELPHTDYSFVDSNIINNLVSSSYYFPIEAGRGCPFNCAYCSTSLFWKRKFRLKSPERIVTEMQEVYNDYGVTKFSFHHDLFTANKKKVLEFCRALKESGMKVVWGCSSRVDTIDAEMIEAMADVGMKNVFLGVESGSPRMQRLMHKNLDIEDVTRVAQLLCKNNVSVTASFMYGFPEETEEDIELTLQLVHKLIEIGVRQFQFHLCTMVPGTEYYNTYKEELVFAEHYSDHVSDFGIKENYDFICEHKSLFPFYYEYHSKLRDDFAHLSKYALLTVFLYYELLKIDKERFENKTIVEFYHECIRSNIDYIESDEVQNNSESLGKLIALRYLPSVYTGDELEKTKEILSFVNDINTASERREDFADVRYYGVDIKAYEDGKPLSEIELATSMVYLKKLNKKLTYVIRRM